MWTLSKNNFCSSSFCFCISIFISVYLFILNVHNISLSIHRPLVQNLWSRCFWHMVLARSIMGHWLSVSSIHPHPPQSNKPRAITWIWDICHADKLGQTWFTIFTQSPVSQIRSAFLYQLCPSFSGMCIFVFLLLFHIKFANCHLGFQVYFSY